MGVWKSWLKLRRRLLLTPSDAALPARWRVDDVIKSMQPFASLDPSKANVLEELLGRLGITHIADLWDSENQAWRDVKECILRLRGLSQWLSDSSIAFLDAIQATKSQCVRIQLGFRYLGMV